MIDFAAARRMMVDGQVRTNDVTDLRIIAAMLDVARERFVPAANRPIAYLDLDVPVGNGKSGQRRMLKPMVLAKMIQAAEVGADDRVLDVGCTTGYSSSILARLAGSVVALEEDTELAKIATENLRANPNATTVTAPLLGGWPDGAPYNVIVCNGATEVVPESLLSQLVDGGRLVCIFGIGPAAKAMLYLRDGNQCGGRAIFDAAAPLLPSFARTPEFVF